MLNPNKNIEVDIKNLKGNDAFIRFLAFIEEEREQCIASLHETSSDNVQQLSGRILSYDQILEITDYKQIRHLPSMLY
tara:strand:+ start:1185 stop:1418 length:234 start_codon:yes stop_codon:yes gene_type:complete